MEHDRSLPLSLSGLAPAALQPAASTYVVEVFAPLSAAKSTTDTASDTSASFSGLTGLFSENKSLRMERSEEKGEEDERAEREVPVLQLIHMDSGGGGMPEDISSVQVQWFSTLIRTQRQRYQRQVPALVFIHIPFQEFAVAWQEGGGGGGGGGQCWREKEDGVSPVDDDGGLFARINATHEVRGVFVGHNHCNDFCCEFSTKKLCFGRHTSYGGYNCEGYVQGARVIDISVSLSSSSNTGTGTGTQTQTQTEERDAGDTPIATAELDIRTHVRLINGDVVHEGSI